MTSDASRIAEHGPKKMGNGEVEREKKEKAFCNAMRHERSKKKKKKTRMTSKNSQWNKKETLKNW